MAALVCGLLALAGGAAGLVMLTGHPVVPLASLAGGPSRAVRVRRPETGPLAGRTRAPGPVSLTSSGHRRALQADQAGLGLTAQGTLQVPTSTSVAGWYTGSPRPGEIGSSVIAGAHRPLPRPRASSTSSGDGLPWRGHPSFVGRANGSLAEFRVYAVRQYPKDHFPTGKVYGPAPDAELNLITCGGTFDYTTRSYLSNTVVYSTEIR